MELPILPRGYSKEDIDGRWNIIRDVTGVDEKTMAMIRGNSLTGDMFKGSCENFIGTMNVPVGIIGPLKIMSLGEGKETSKIVFVPAATTEGSVIASYSRGSRVMSLAGGCKTLCYDNRFITGPCLQFEDMKQSHKFYEWIQGQEEPLRQVAKKSDPFLEYTGMHAIIDGKRVFLSLFWKTGDAAGQNMSFIGTDEVYKYILANAPISCRPTGVTLESHSGEKKASGSAFTMTRGRTVSSECFVPDFLLKKYLRVDAEFLTRAQADITKGGILKGLLVNHLQFANFYAAVQIALGQDPANTVECTAGVVNFEVARKPWINIKDGIAPNLRDSVAEEVDKDGMIQGLYGSVHLPGIVCGSVGGGTRLPSQSAAIRILNVNSANEMAEIYAAVALAGEISFTAAIIANEWANSNKVHGRAVHTSDSQPSSTEITPVTTPVISRRKLENESAGSPAVVIK